MPILSYPSSSTSETVKDVLAYATAAAGNKNDSNSNNSNNTKKKDEELLFVRKVVDGIRKEKNWRWNYPIHAINHVRVCAESSKEDCLSVANAGLERLYDTFLYDDNNGNNNNKKRITLKEALVFHRQQRRRYEEESNNNKSSSNSIYFGTGKISCLKKNKKKNDDDEGNNAIEENHNNNKNDNQPACLSLPMKKDVVLKGEEVNRQMLDWYQRGIIEADTASAICNLRQKDLVLDNYVFVVMGAGAEMGPLDALLSLGATVIALDLPRPSVWKRLVQKLTLNNNNNNNASLVFPITNNNNNDNNTTIEIVLDDNDKEQSKKLNDLLDRAGCNLLTQIPELIDWLVIQYPTKTLVLGQYAYMDSSAFVRVSLAMDAIASEVLKERSNNKTSTAALAYLCSPTDVFVVPPAAESASQKNYKNDPNNFHSFLKRIFSGKRILEQNIVPETRSNNNGKKMPLVDGLIVQQGPNYFLAKRLQHWRAMLTSSSQNTTNIKVSSNVAPASYTVSVTKNKLLFAGYLASHNFNPIEIFTNPQTSNVLMTYLLLHDLSNTKTTIQQHPLKLFSSTPVHNGIWRCGYQIRSLLELAIAYYVLDTFKPELVTTAGVSTVGAAILLRSRL